MQSFNRCGMHASSEKRADESKNVIKVIAVGRRDAARPQVTVIRSLARELIVFLLPRPHAATAAAAAAYMKCESYIDKQCVVIGLTAWCLLVYY